MPWPWHGIPRSSHRRPHVVVLLRIREAARNPVGRDGGGPRQPRATLEKGHAWGGSLIRNHRRACPWLNSCPSFVASAFGRRRVRRPSMCGTRQYLVRLPLFPHAGFWLAVFWYRGFCAIGSQCAKAIAKIAKGISNSASVGSRQASQESSSDSLWSGLAKRSMDTKSNASRIAPGIEYGRVVMSQRPVGSATGPECRDWFAALYRSGGGSRNRTFRPLAPC